MLHTSLSGHNEYSLAFFTEPQELLRELALQLHTKMQKNDGRFFYYLRLFIQFENYAVEDGEKKK
jgi:hypothetical protein